MRSIALRLSRIVVVALLASSAILWANGRGLGWLGWTVAIGLLAGALGMRFVRLPFPLGRPEARWEAALYAAHKRPLAIQEVRRALRKLEPVRQRSRSEHTRLSILLAELLDAEGRCEEASAAVDTLPLGALAPLEAALVRHTRAVTHLRASDPKGALEALSERTPSGDLELEQRLSLLESYAKLELGDAAQALKLAAEMEHARGAEESVVLEARVVRAAALDALGRREEALVTLAALGRESLEPLADLGQPRVRALAKTVLESSEA
jgi:hypothetical protein